MRLIILDLDNCISDDEWRIPLIDWTQRDPIRRYAKYHAAAPADECGNRHLFEGRAAAVFTARPECYRAQTATWLREKGVPVRHLFMRPMRDHRPSRLLKMAQLARLLSAYRVTGPPSELIVAAYDDRADVVQMYREAGLNAHVAYIHTTSAYAPQEVHHER